MRSRFISLLPTICGVLICTGPAHADVVFVNANQCQPTGVGSPDRIVHDPIGVHTAPDENTPQIVSCAVWRAPSAPPSNSFTFIIDGNNDPNVSTTCLAVVRNGQTGDMLDSKRVVMAQQIYAELFINEPFGATVPMVYISVLCELPANNGGTLRGFTWIQ